MKMTVLSVSVALLITACSSIGSSSIPEPVSSMIPAGELISNIVEGEQAHPESIQALIDAELEGDNFKVGRVLAETASYTRYYITYTSQGGLKISGIMNVPHGEGPFPLIITNHGYISPEVYTNGRGLKREQDYLAKHGYVVVHPDYRGHADSDPDPVRGRAQNLGYTGYAADSLNAIIAIKKAGLPYVDTERVGILGHSMGGAVTLVMAVSHPELIDAIVLFAPSHANFQENYNRWRKNSYTDEENAALADEIGPLDSPFSWDPFSASQYYSDIDDPIMFHHGTADESVPLQWSEKMSSDLEGIGKDVTLYVYDGEPHEFTRAWFEVMSRSVEFFNIL